MWFIAGSIASAGGDGTSCNRGGAISAGGGGGGTGASTVPSPGHRCQLDPGAN